MGDAVTMGHPPLPTEKVRNEVLSVRFTNAELEFLERAASLQDGGMPLHEWVRETLFSFAEFVIEDETGVETTRP